MALDDIIFCFVAGFGMGILFMTIIASNSDISKYHVLSELGKDLKYCPHAEYYYNNISNCDSYGITPEHPSLNLTGYGQ